MKKVFLFLIILTALTEGCKKYPDGPLISFRSPTARFFDGDKTLTKYNVNGVDSLSRYKDSLCTDFHFYKNENGGKDLCSMAGSRNDGWMSTLGWQWELINNNKVLKVLYSGGNPAKLGGTGPFKNNVLSEWEILKLKADDIIMSTTYNDKEYQIELTR